MHSIIIQSARTLACEIIREAGELLKQKFDQISDIQIKDDYGDVVTEADHLVEEILLPRIRAAFPTHQIRSEEAGIIGEENDWLWLIDPLDGTNNFAIGLSVFAVSITLMFRREAVLGVVYEPMTDRLFVAVQGEGASCNGIALAVRPSVHLHRGTVGWIQGHRVQKDDRARLLRQHIDSSFKRMLRLWAPTLLWSMLAKGDIDGIVLYNSEGDDLYSGLLLVKEAGGAVIDFEGRPFSGMREDPYLIACHPDHCQSLLNTVNEGLAGP